MALPSTSYIASAITGVSGLRPSDITFRHVRVRMKPLADRSLVESLVPESEGRYPVCWMFDHALPAAALYLRHADRVTLEDFRVESVGSDVRKEIFAEDASWTRKR